MNKILAFFAALLILASCKDNSSEPSNSPLLPMDEGNYWIYEHYDKDTLGNIQESSLEYDSTAVHGPVTINGRSGMVFRSYFRSPGNNYDLEDYTDDYYSEDNDHLYAHTSVMTDMLGGFLTPDEIGLEEGWLRIIDRNQNIWPIDTVKIDTINIPFLGIPLYGDIIIMGSKNNTKSFTVKGENINATDYLIQFEFEGFTQYNGFAIPIEFTQKQHYYFYSGIGLISQEVEQTKLPLINMTIPGQISILNNYKVK
ncbi:MAG: hypothetical protein ACLFR2_11085 [Candidatus Kapaibacterium sp.]